MEYAGEDDVDKWWGKILQKAPEDAEYARKLLLGTWKSEILVFNELLVMFLSFQ